MRREQILAAFVCVVALGSFLYFFSGCLNPTGMLQAGTSRPHAPDFKDVDVVNTKSSLPEKVLEYLDLGSTSWQDFYQTNCCGDIYISVRTSRQTQERRLPVIVPTWMQTIPPNQVSWMDPGGSDSNWFILSRSICLQMLVQWKTGGWVWHINMVGCSNSLSSYSYYTDIRNSTLNWSHLGGHLNGS